MPIGELARRGRAGHRADVLHIEDGLRPWPKCAVGTGFDRRATARNRRERGPECSAECSAPGCNASKRPPERGPPAPRPQAPWHRVPFRQWAQTARIGTLGTSAMSASPRRSRPARPTTTRPRAPATRSGPRSAAAPIPTSPPTWTGCAATWRAGSPGVSANSRIGRATRSAIFSPPPSPPRRPRGGAHHPRLWREAPRASRAGRAHRRAGGAPAGRSSTVRRVTLRRRLEAHVDLRGERTRLPPRPRPRRRLAALARGDRRARGHRRAGLADRQDRGCDRPRVSLHADRLIGAPPGCSGAPIRSVSDLRQSPPGRPHSAASRAS